jgi:hypothetical protein
MSGGIATSSHIIEVRTKGARPLPPRAVSIPKGWKSYAYGGVTISVPKSWAVKHNTNCPNTSAPGVLLLGYPKSPYHCPAYQYSDNSFAIYGLGATSLGGGPVGKPIKVNGVSVYVGFGSSIMQQWTVVGLGIQIEARGSDSNRILHTLRRS